MGQQEPRREAEAGSALTETETLEKKQTFRACAAFGHSDFGGDYEISCCYGDFELITADDKPCLRFSDWRLGADLDSVLPTREKGSYPLDDVEAPILATVDLDAEGKPALRIQEWQGACDNVVLNSHNAF